MHRAVKYVAVPLAVAIAGCGGSAKPITNADSSGHESFLRFSECMREHGVRDFPDPGGGGGIEVSPASGFDPRSPAVQAAQQSCKHLLPGGGPQSRQLPESARLKLLGQAECMRA